MAVLGTVPAGSGCWPLVLRHLEVMHLSAAVQDYKIGWTARAYLIKSAFPFGFLCKRQTYS